MPSDLQDRIHNLLEHKPGLKAQQIATELGLDRAQILAALHGPLASNILQDNAYRWWPKPSHSGAAGTALSPEPQGRFARFCRYYLDCLSRESGSGISIPLDSVQEFVELDKLPFDYADAWLPETDRAVGKLIQKVRRERGQLVLYVGYALRIRTLYFKSQDSLRLQPILLYPIEDSTERADAPLQPSTGVPLFNLDVLRSLPSADSGNLIDEAIHLSEELGLANAEDDLPAWDEIILRLQRCRPDWGWRETLDPYALSTAPPLADIAPSGIYNRAILFAGTRSPFTYGLEVELRKLAQQGDDAVRDTALGQWLRGDPAETPAPEDRPILELLPLNTEQRQSVVQALDAALTVVTGPPGTGKSQVVASVLANMAWQGRSVLFASKNNHAVDVVESRVNDLGSNPLLLRLGKEEHHGRIVQNLAAGLAEAPRPGDAERYQWLMRAHQQTRERFAFVQGEMRSVVDLRNTVDELERAAEPGRAIFPADRFAGLRFLRADEARCRLDALAAAIRGAREALQPKLLRRESAKTRSLDRLAEAARNLADDAALLGAGPSRGDDLDAWQQFHDSLANRLRSAERVQAYQQSLDRLRAARPIEDLASELTRIADESARDSLELWQCWLRLWPSRWKPDQRKLLSEYVSLLQMIAGGDSREEGAGRKVFRRYYSLFPQITKILPCWAVTSLSARGRLPFEAGLFDLVVIDEASQCDIASALPLLFRARRAVIIGDPLQLKHVSTLAPQQDRLLLASHGLAEGEAAWAYSVNSLFDVARSLCRHEDIVTLRDHHRSHRDIIGFSNRHFYRGGLRIATDHDRLNRPQTSGPAVRWIDVRGRVTRPSAGGAINVAEAEAAIAEIRKLVMEQDYSGTIGMVTPFRAQANKLRALLHQDPELTRRVAERQFLIDTVHGFQGAERDVIIFSPTVSMGVHEGTLRFLKNNGYLFNVAITRARSELVVVGDRQAALDSGVSYLAGFADYFRSLGARPDQPREAGESGPEYPSVSNPDLVSPWERIFYKALYAAGLHPVPQYEESPFTLDFALLRDDRKLDIEVDGDHYHRNWDGELCRRDQIRTRRLNDLGWDVMRFWVYEIRDEVEACVARVKAWASPVL